ncbi:hypothetical protein [Streptomyces jumonjinensis]|uniref:hypothetical protein n=1 Tax=Streptomyces jumonjinensis TaxID=1945 RepID=UPI001E4A2289|nr:hypothetical protein [Streptomyces jumonjinensis]
MRNWPPRQWAVAVLVAAVSALAIGAPTGVVPTGLFTRMTPVLWWNYPVWAGSSILMGLLAATYAGGGARQGSAGPRGARALAAGALSVFAVGCPVCNKLVVLALGMSGAMSYWAPAQPVLALLSLGLLAHALVRRLRTAAACSVPGREAPGPGTAPAVDGSAATMNGR